MHIEYRDSVFSAGIRTDNGNAQDKPAMQALLNYILSKTSIEPAFHSTLSSLLAPKTQVHDQSQAHLGLVLCERLINMPVQVILPMYRMLIDEIKQAIADVCSYYTLV